MQSREIGKWGPWGREEGGTGLHASHAVIEGYSYKHPRKDNPMVVLENSRSKWCFGGASNHGPLQWLDSQSNACLLHVPASAWIYQSCRYTLVDTWVAHNGLRSINHRQTDIHKYNDSSRFIAQKEQQMMFSQSGVVPQLSSSGLSCDDAPNLEAPK